MRLSGGINLEFLADLDDAFLARAEGRTFGMRCFNFKQNPQVLG